MVTLLRFKDISISKHETDKFVTLALYLLRQNNNKSVVYDCIQKKLYLVNDLKANLLLGTDIIRLEQIFIVFLSNIIYITSYKIRIFLDT